MTREPARGPNLLYWLIAASAIVLGFVGAASIGLPLFALGILLVVRGIAGKPRPGFWPPIIGIVLFFVGFQVVGRLWGPLSCTTVHNITQEIGPGETEPTTIDNTRTRCDSPFLPRRIQGEGPAWWPVILGSVGTSFAGAFLSRIALTRVTRRKTQPDREAEPGTIREAPSRLPEANFLYWLLTSAFIVFGFLAMFTVGLPLLILGLALAALSDVRDRPAAFWPPLAGIVVFFATYILVAPLTCIQTVIPVVVDSDAATPAPVGATTCTRILLPDYSGVGDPALWPIVLLAGTAGVAGGA
jgi:hypothetical protein